MLKNKIWSYTALVDVKPYEMYAGEKKEIQGKPNKIWLT